MRYRKPNPYLYKGAQAVSWLVSTFIFKRKILRNEIKDKEGPFVVIANHQAALDFVNIIGLTRRPMTFVISNSFYNSLPVNGILNKLGVIPKQQFQTSTGDMKKIKAVIDEGQPLVIYPAGLMCEDGISTPIPRATYKFLKWLKADVYVARTSGTYFVMPKWTSGLRAGRTYMDVYKLFSKEELAEASLETVQQKTEEALLFDAYREQEKYLVEYKDSDNIENLENVLYMCPNCLSEFTMKVKNKNTIYCTACGYAEESDKFSFLHRKGNIGRELRYVSDWSRLIFQRLKEKLANDIDSRLSAETKIHMLDFQKHKFAEVGEGTVSLSRKHFLLEGRINGEPVSLTVPIRNVPTLPFSPGKQIEIQDGGTIYRCVLKDGRLAMKFINMVKAFYELENAVKA